MALPVDPQARLSLQRQLLAGSQPLRGAIELLFSTAQLSADCLAEAAERCDWSGALDLLRDLVPLVDTMAVMAPDQAEEFWSAYATLIGQLMPPLQAALQREGEDALAPDAAAGLCADLVTLLRPLQQQSFPLPHWIPVQERQLVRRGALAAHQHVRQSRSEAASRQALGLALRLAELENPIPPWVARLCWQLLMPLLRKIQRAEPLEPAAVAELLGWLQRFPFEEATAPRARSLASRALHILEVIAPDLEGLRPRPQPDAPQAAPDVSAAQIAENRPARLVLLPAGAEGASELLDLGPLLRQLEGGDLLGAGPKGVDQLLDDFCWHLAGTTAARPASETLLESLEPQWQEGLRLSSDACGLLAYAAAAWQRRLGERIDPLPPSDWHDGLLVELTADELAVLAPLTAHPDGLRDGLAELRRLHHDTEFWTRRQELPWMAIPPPQEALRRLHVDQGFYALSHDPLTTLCRWGEDAIAALLASDPWTDDAAVLGHWIALAQELVGLGRGPLPPLGQPPLAEQLLAEFSGLELVYVGDRSEAVATAHRAGQLFRGRPFGLRCLAAPDSRYPRRPAASLSESLEALLGAVEGLYRQRPFAVLLADCGAYRLPLMHRVHQRYGVSCLSSALPMADWLGNDAASPSTRE
ncbi:conserved protein of unknown function [Cyanobium sp. NIES-981]|nr:conserved protein of unknown function [Cyanobium sp. NIES-981]